MATIVAVRSGNWSDTSHETGPWPGASTPTTKPAVGDTVQTAEFVIEIDEDVTVTLLEATDTDQVGAGYFTVTAIAGDGTRTITAHLQHSGSADAALSISNSTGLVEFVGDIATSGNGHGIYNAGIMGNVTGAIAGDSDHFGIYNAYTMGNVVGDIGPGGIYNTGIMGDVTGNVTGGEGGRHGIHNANTMGNIIGDVTGNTAYGVYNSGRVVYDEFGQGVNYYSTMGSVTGNVTGGVLGFSGIYNAILGLEECVMGNVTGNVTGGGSYNSPGIYDLTQGVPDIDGTLTYGPTGAPPVLGAMRLVARATNAMTFIDTTDAALTLSNDYPAVADVKDGVVYNRGTLEGELAAGGGVGPVSITINITGAGCS
jgi:hypothetical protein